MSLLKKGQTIDVGIGDGIHDENGRSAYIFIDVDEITEDEVVNLFPGENVLYVEAVTDEQAIDWGKENPVSEYLK